MSYFNPAQETEVIVDASPVGLGGLLVQDGKVISYASRALSDVESRYSQTEREMPAIVCASDRGKSRRAGACGISRNRKDEALNS